MSLEEDCKESNGCPQIPRLGLGTWLSNDREQCRLAVRFAIQCGYRHIDCAYIYGNQVDVGLGISDAISSSVVKRKDLFITSKVWNTYHSFNSTIRNVGMILDELGLEYLDACLIHWPMAYKEGPETFPKGPDGKILVNDEIDYLETWRALEQCVFDKKIRWIGLSNFNSTQISRVINSSTIRPSILEVEMHPYFQQRRLVDFCRAEQIQLIAYSPLGQSPQSPFFLTDRPSIFRDPVIGEIAAAHQMTNVQVVLCFIVQRNSGNVCVIPKSVTMKHIRENIAVFRRINEYSSSNFILSEEELSKLDSLDLGSLRGRIIRLPLAQHAKHYPLECVPDEFSFGKLSTTTDNQQQELKMLKLSFFESIPDFYEPKNSTSQ